jgi:sialidase-1
MKNIFKLLLLIPTMWACSESSQPEVPVFSNVFIAGQEEVLDDNGNNYFQFREQNIIVTNSGKLVVIVQGRDKSNWSDRSGQDLVAKISEDNGASWSKPIVMVRDGSKSICPNASVYDKETGRIISLYSVFQWPYTDAESRKTWEGLKNRQYYVYSDDDGQSWSEPVEITEIVKNDTVTQVFGSGEGIQLKHGPNRGRLVVPGGDFTPPNKRVFAWYSDDHGETWQSSEIVPNPHDRLTPCENAIAELSNGTLLMNERNSGLGQRWKSISNDGGLTWEPFEPIPDLPSISCNASIIPVEYNGDEVILYAGPVGPNADVVNTVEEYGERKLKSPERRSNGVVFASFDGGLTWPFRKLVVADQFAYSSLMELPDNTIGLFYETNHHKDIRLVKFSLDWLFEESI